MDMFELFAATMILLVSAPIWAPWVMLFFLAIGLGLERLFTLISKYRQKHIKNNPIPQEMKKALDMAYHKGFEEGIDKNKRDVTAAFEAKSRAILAQHLEKMKNFKEGLEKDKKKKAKRGRK